MESNQCAETISTVVGIHMNTTVDRKEYCSRLINLKPYFQRNYEAWNDALKIGLIESILNGFAINPIWVIENDDEDCRDVLDGQHRLHTIKDFIENKFFLSKKFLTLLSKEDYDKKFFKDLSMKDQTKFKSYRLHFNILDSSHNNEERIDYWYTVLNKCSAPLNLYEQSKTIRSSLYQLIEEFEEPFYNSPIFKSKTSKRGNLHTIILKILALTENIPQSFLSLEHLKEKWIEKNFGKIKSDVDAEILKQKETLIRKIKMIIKYMNTFKDSGLFTDERNIQTIQIMCGRLCSILPEKFLIRHVEVLTNELTKEIFDKTDVDLCKELQLEKISRNSQFQKRMIKYIDFIIHSKVCDDIQSKRFFSKLDIEKKLQDQKRICALCHVLITESQNYEGDHIVSWASGGNTSYDNLQVVHRICHMKK